MLCAVAAFAVACAASAQMRGFADTIGPAPRDTEREPREPPGWDRDREAGSASEPSPQPVSSPPSAWTPPIETPGPPPMRAPEFAAARCETYRRQMAEAYEAERRGENRAAERETIQQARQRAGC
jgi:hypothetical protein